MTVPRIDRSDLGVLLIDVQPAFLELAFPDGGPVMKALLTRLEHLLMLADWMELPFITTFEIPTDENGELPPRLEAVVPANAGRFEKDYFGCADEPAIREAFEQWGCRQIVVAGAETDVCVLQSTLGLLEMGFEVFLLEDCVFTTEAEPGPALQRMYACGAVPCTLKTLAYELTRCVTDLPWYPDLGWSDGAGAKPFPQGFTVPEQWPAWKSSR